MGLPQLISHAFPETVQVCNSKILPAKPIFLARDTAFNGDWRYISPNNKTHMRQLVFDLDEPGAPWLDHGLPQPNFVVYSRDTMRAHCFYRIAVPMRKDPAAKSYRYGAAIIDELTDRLGFDPAYTGVMAKNPANDHWLTRVLNPDPYSLRDLSQHLDLGFDWRAQMRRRAPVTPAGRNCALFEELRFYAYAAKVRARSRETLLDMCRQKADEINAQFPTSMELSEVWHTVKSVGNWTWDHYTGGGGKNRGTMGLRGSALSLKTKQEFGAAHTARVRADATATKIKAVLANIRACGQPMPPATELAKLVGIGRASLYRHADLWAPKVSH